MVRDLLLFVVVLLGFAGAGWAQESDATADASDAGKVRTQIEDQFEAMAERLALTDDQRVALEPILQAQFADTRSILESHGLDQQTENPASRQERRALFRELRQRNQQTQAQVAEILSEEQMVAYRELQAERRARMRERFRHAPDD